MSILRHIGTHVLVWFASSVPASAWAHEFMTKYVTHEVRVLVGSVNIDISVDLTFNELVSLEERRKMDQNEDGWVGPGEGADYLARFAKNLARGVRLTVGGRSVDVYTLYEPQLDLLGAEQVAPAHHVLRLSYFARIPSTFSIGQELLLQDDLWADAPALCLFQTTGAREFRVSLASSGKVVSVPDAGAGGRAMRIKTNKIS